MDILHARVCHGAGFLDGSKFPEPRLGNMQIRLVAYAQERATGVATGVGLAVAGRLARCRSDGKRLP